MRKAAMQQDQLNSVERHEEILLIRLRAWGLRAHQIDFPDQKIAYAAAACDANYSSCLCKNAGGLWGVGSHAGLRTYL